MKKTPARLSGWQVVLSLLILPLSAVLLLIVSRSLPGAASAAWSTPVDVSRTTYGSYGPDLVYDSQGYAHVVWYGNGEVDTQWGIWYSNNRTGSWSAIKRIVPEGNLRFPKMAIDTSNRLHVVYEDRGAKEIMYALSGDYGQTWSKTNVSNSPGVAYEPNIAVDADGNVHVVWIDNRWTGIYHLTYSKKTGTSWSAPVMISTPTNFNKGPGVTTTGSGANLRVHISTYSKRSADPDYTYEVYYTRGTGTTWESGVNLSNTGNTASYDPSITATGTSIYVAWDESTTSHDIRMRASHDNGSNWIPIVQVTNDTGRSRFPNIYFGLGQTQIVYDSDTFSPNKGDIFYTNYDPGSGTVAAPTNLSNSAGDSQLAAVYADACKVGAAWQDKTTQWGVYYSATPCGPTPTPVPTQAPNPHGWVDIRGHDPLGSTQYTRRLDVTLFLSATSDVGAKIPDMRVCNMGDCDPLPGWQSFAPAISNWNLLDTGYDCEFKWVYAWFRDELGRESNRYADVIDYDNFATATMSLNNGNAWTNQTAVMINSVNRDAQLQDCSGLSAMRMMEVGGGLGYTVWITYYPELYFFLSPSGPLNRTVQTEYQDHANNFITLTDSIQLDITPPYTGTAPKFGGTITTTHRFISVTNLWALDAESGVKNVWLANRSTGPWKTFPYVPGSSYNWDLWYGGPPTYTPGIHYVFARYEDAAGFGSFPGNLSQVFYSSIHIQGSRVFLPIVTKKYTKQMQAGPPAAPTTPAETDLVLMATPLQYGPSGDVLLLLALRRSDGGPLDGTFRMTLPEGLRVVRAWSAYGRLLEVSDHLVVSHEQVSGRGVPWILVHARVEAGASDALQVQGEMTWDGGSIRASPVQLPLR